MYRKYDDDLSVDIYYQSMRYEMSIDMKTNRHQIVKIEFKGHTSSDSFFMKYGRFDRAVY